MKEFDPGDSAASIVSVTDRVHPVALGMPVTSVHFLGADKGRVAAEKMHRGDRHADRKRAHAVGDRNDGGGVVAGIELFHHVVIQLSKPSRIICSGNSRPMKMRRLSRASPSFQARW